MTERIKSLLDRTFDKEQKKFRRDVDWKPLLQKFIDEKVGDEARARIGLEEMLKAEQPAFMEGETIHFLRTVKQILISILRRRWRHGGSPGRRSARRASSST